MKMEATMLTERGAEESGAPEGAQLFSVLATREAITCAELARQTGHALASLRATLEQGVAHGRLERLAPARLAREVEPPAAPVFYRLRRPCDGAHIWQQRLPRNANQMDF